MESRENVDAADKRWAAMHEAAYLVVSFATGGRSRAEIWRVDPDSQTGDRSWTGEATAMRSYLPEPVVGVAGFVAEKLAENPDATAPQLSDLWWADVDGGTLSGPAQPSDADRREVLDAIESAMALLSKNRKFYEWAFEKLLAEQVIPVGAAAGAFAAH